MEALLYRFWGLATLYTQITHTNRTHTISIHTNCQRLNHTANATDLHDLLLTIVYTVLYYVPGEGNIAKNLHN